MSHPPNPNRQDNTDDHPCPNPSCDLVYTSHDNVCNHLAEIGSPCTQWAMGVVDTLLRGQAHAEEEADDDNDEAIPSLIPVYEGANSDNNDPLPPPPAPRDATPPPVTSIAGLNKVYHPNASIGIPGGLNLLEQVHAGKGPDDEHAKARLSNPYYPFSSRRDWQLAKWLTDSSLTQAEIDGFMKLDRIKDDPPSFASARALRDRIEVLPDVPAWKFEELKIPGYATKTPMILYWRDGLEVVESLFSNPVFATCMETTPYKLVDGDGLRVVGDFMSANFAWEYQSRLATGRTMLGIILASDKTPLTVGTGNREMHPLYLALANIEAGVRMKASSCSFALVAYMPIPKFKNVPPPVHAALVARVFHSSVEIVTKTLQIAERNGHTMPDPCGLLRTCHTPLASFIGDRPEQLMIACVRSNESATSIAQQHQFGDASQHPPRTREHTLGLLRTVLERVDPHNIPLFVRESFLIGLNGVHRPFWFEWGSADPSLFLTPDALHAWHKFYFDHVLKWVINIIGGEELDRRMSVLQKRVGVRHWPNGISKLKQVTGREHRELQKILVAVIAGAVDDQVLCCIRAMGELIFHSQGLLLYDEHLSAINEAHREFHHFKNAIILAGGRRGKRGIINHFDIPKLEGFSRIVYNAWWLGAPFQYTSDVTERLHMEYVKRSYRASNRRAYDEQCTRWMDRLEKMRLFGLYTILRGNGLSLMNLMVNEASSIADHYPEATWLAHVLPEDELRLQGATSLRPSLFQKARSRLSADLSIAFLVTLRPHYPRVTIRDASEQFNLPDLRGALGDFFLLKMSHDARNGHRRSSTYCELPFATINIWKSFRVQQQSSQDSRILIPPMTVQALPPSQDMPFGRCNTVLVDCSGGSGGDDCHRVMQVRMIFSPINPDRTQKEDTIYFYGEFFRFSNAYRKIVDGKEVFEPAPHIDMFVLNRHLRADGTRVGDIFPLTAVREVVELVPKFGRQMRRDLNCDNSLEIVDTFYLNNFADRETFHAILSYQ